jgi:thiamine-monophosphate kinase
MAVGEFELIERYFRQPAQPLLAGRSDVVLGIGDDAALLQVPAGRQLVAALDTLVEGRHFPRGTPPESLGHRALAVNLSDLAAMGADPAWFLLSLTLPAADETFLCGFARGMLNLAQQYQMALVGGDTTSGPLSVSVQALGLVPPGEALLRSGGRPGDLLFVSGFPGEAAIGLQLELGSADFLSLTDTQLTQLRQKFLYPTPRVELGRALRGIASACIDVSDGLAADALKLAAASGCGVRIDVEHLPLSESLRMLPDRHRALQAVLAGGDDYELCFTVPAARVAELNATLGNVKCPMTCVGLLQSKPGLCVLEAGNPVNFDLRGFDHFVSTE